MSTRKPMIDTHVYYVTTINDYRSIWMTLEQAQRHAKMLRSRMNTAGWAGPIDIFYRDGTRVAKV